MKRKPVATAAVKMVKLADLRAHPRNPRRHDRGEIDALKASMLENGFTEPIVRQLSSLLVVAGAGRIQAATELAAEGKLDDLEFTPGVRLNGCLPVVDKHLTDRQALAYLLADNQLTLRGSWDFPLVKDILITDLGLTADVAAFDLPVGFDLPELQSLEGWTGKGDPLKSRTGKPGLTDDDAVPDSAPARTKPGDVWLCGKHRVMCGDSTKPEDVARLMAGGKWGMVFTSPPYGTGDNKGYKTDYYGKTKRFYVHENDALTQKQWLVLCRGVLCRAADLRDSDAAPFVLNVMYNANCRQGYGLLCFGGVHPFKVQETICWDKLKGFPSATKGILSRNWELVFVLSVGEDYFTTQEQNEVRWCKWDICRPEEQSPEHHAAFPVGLPSRAIQDYSKPGASIYDPFLGSGTTLIACEKLGRVCRGMEICEKYVDVAVKRWEQFTGLRAVKAGKRA